MANPVTHLEKTIAGEVQPVTHLEKVIAEYGGGDVYEQLEAGTNILIEETADGKAKISASGEISSEDTVARAEIAAIKDGETLDSFGDVETALATKADTSTTYTKTEVDTALSAKANSADVYSKSDIDTAMSAKADKSTTYTKTEVDTALGNKVDKVSGKGLSTNDYTTAEKTKLAGIEAQANKTTVDDALSGSSTNPVQNKVVKSALDGKANASTTYTKTEVDTALSGKQNAIDSSHKLSADLVDDTNATNKFATAEELEQIQTNKNNILTLTPTVQQAVSANVTSDYTLITSLNAVIARRVGGSAAINRVTAFAEGGSVGVRGIIISKSNDSTAFDNSTNMLAKIEQETGVMGALSVSCIYYNGTNNNDVPVYIWVKGAATGTARTYSINERLRD